jgi:hypothetical protein
MLKRGKQFIVIAIVFSTFFSPILALADHVELRYVNALQQNHETKENLYTKTIAQLIYDEAQEHDINARLILIMLQKESSAVTRSAPSSDTTRAWPLFYMYDERMANCLLLGRDCNDIRYGTPTYEQRAADYGGVGLQVAYATARLQQLANEGNRIVSVDGQTITTDNTESYALYKYTPHFSSYNTSSAFYTNWVSWWGEAPNKGNYSNTNIIHPNNFRNTNPMSASDIENFLVSKGSWLASYQVPQYVSVPYPVLVSDTPPPAPRKTGDANRDGNVDLLDLSLIATHWGGNNADADLNGDGVVDLLDLSILAGAWGS